MESFDVAVIGAGPGGYVAAIRAAQLGLKAALVERRPTLGGTCLNVGCIPSKALLESSELYAIARGRLGEHGIGVAEVTLDLATLMARKERIVKEVVDGLGVLMKKNKIAVIAGSARFEGPHRLAVDGEATTALEAQHVIIATGSAPVELPFLPFDGAQVVSSTEALALDRVPEHLVVIGAGAVGLELGSVWRRLGAQVTVLEMLPQIAPFADAQMARTLERSLKQQGLEIRTKTRVVGAEIKRGKVALEIEPQKGGSEALACDKVLVAVGRRPYTEGLGLDQAGVPLGEGGFISVDAELRTPVDGVWAIGDAVGHPMLAHKAEEEGIAVAERIAGMPGHVNYAAIPNVVYTWPELAAVGASEEQAKAEGREVKVGRYYFKANARAKTMGEEDGLVKVLADKESDRLLGVHIVGPRASDMIAEAAVAMEFSASAEDIARSVHAHPTLAEAVKEAALAVDRRAIHG